MYNRHYTALLGNWAYAYINTTQPKTNPRRNTCVSVTKQHTHTSTLASNELIITIL